MTNRPEQKINWRDPDAVEHVKEMLSRQISKARGSKDWSFTGMMQAADISPISFSGASLRGENFIGSDLNLLKEVFSVGGLDLRGCKFPGQFSPKNNWLHWKTMAALQEPIKSKTALRSTVQGRGTILGNNWSVQGDVAVIFTDGDQLFRVLKNGRIAPIDVPGYVRAAHGSIDALFQVKNRIIAVTSSMFVIQIALRNHEIALIDLGDPIGMGVVEARPIPARWSVLNNLYTAEDFVISAGRHWHVKAGGVEPAGYRIEEIDDIERVDPTQIGRYAVIWNLLTSRLHLVMNEDYSEQPVHTRKNDFDQPYSQWVFLCEGMLPDYLSYVNFEDQLWVELTSMSALDAMDDFHVPWSYANLQYSGHHCVHCTHDGRIEISDYSEAPKAKVKREARIPVRANSKISRKRHQDAEIVHMDEEKIILRDEFSGIWLLSTKGKGIAGMQIDGSLLMFDSNSCVFEDHIYIALEDQVLAVPLLQLDDYQNLA